CAVLGRPELAADPRFVTNPLRVQNRMALLPLLEKEVARRRAAEWLQKLEQAGIPCAPGNSIDRVFGEPQTAAREMLIDVPHPTIGPLKMAGTPLKLASLAPAPRKAPPLLGEHTDQVLGNFLKLTSAEIAALHTDGIV